MATITAITPQKRNKERVSIHLDGEFAFGLALITAANLHVGQVITKEEIAALQESDSVEQAKQLAMRYLSYRPRSIAEVQQYLRKKEISTSTIDKVIQRLSELELLDDAAFARYWLEQRETFRPRSILALRQELQQKGIGRDLIDSTLANLDETAAARRAAESKARVWAKLPQQQFFLKMGQFLQRRGFNYAVSKQVTQEIWDSLANHPKAITS